VASIPRRSRQSQAARAPSRLRHSRRGLPAATSLPSQAAIDAYLCYAIYPCCYAISLCLNIGIPVYIEFKRHSIRGLPWSLSHWRP
jgi:hypothetical protein